MNIDLTLDNFWRSDPGEIRDQVIDLWKKHGGPVGEEAEKRLQQIVFVVRTREGRVVGLSTAFKAHVRQLRNHFYVFRLMISPDYRIPGLTSRLLVSTRDFLESASRQEEKEVPIGLFTLVQHPELKRHRNEAVWPASKMVYIGNSPEGHHIRVYYFDDARIAP